MITSSSLPSLPPYPCSFPLLLLTYPPTYPFSLLPTHLLSHLPTSHLPASFPPTFLSFLPPSLFSFFPSFLPPYLLTLLPVLTSTGQISIESGHVVEWSSEENYLFRLTAFRDQLLDWVNTRPYREFIMSLYLPIPSARDT